MTLFGPIQLVAVRFDRIDRFRGGILAALDEVEGRGVIHLLDALFVMRDDDGEFVRMSLDDDTAEVRVGTVLAALLGVADPADTPDLQSGDDGVEIAWADHGLAHDDVRRLADDLTPGTAVALLLFEHRWAAELAASIREAGGTPVVQGFLTPELHTLIGAELEAVLRAEATIEFAEAVEGAALLDALSAVAAADQVTRAAETAAGDAVAEAETAVVAAELVRAAVAADVIRTLIAAGLIEDAAARDAVEALVAADLLEQSTADQAARTATESAQSTTVPDG